METTPQLPELTRSGSWVKKITRQKITQTPDQAIEDADYSHHHFYEVDASKLVFKNCKFNYAVIERSYFRGAKFKNCVFTGARLIDSNFRSTEFAGCTFDYVTIQRTALPVPEVLRNLPSWPNVRRDFIQQLRANALSLADSSYMNMLVEKELRAERDHWREARTRPSGYYEQKYSRWNKRLEAFWHSFRLWMDQFAWGHGESLVRLTITTAIVLIALAICLWLDTFSAAPNGFPLDQLWPSIVKTWELFIDLPSTDSANIATHRIWATSVILSRYLSLGLFISVLFRKLSKR